MTFKLECWLGGVTCVVTCLNIEGSCFEGGTDEYFNVVQFATIWVAMGITMRSSLCEISLPG